MKTQTLTSWMHMKETHLQGGILIRTMKTGKAQYILALITSLMLTCCKGNQQHNGVNVSPSSLKESTIKLEDTQKDTALSFVISSYNDISKADFKWIKEIERKFPTKANPIIWFKYDCIVDGYQVTGRFLPTDYESEMGQMIMRFDNGDKVFFYQSIWDDDYFICFPIFYMINDDDSFKKWENKALYSLHYSKPEDNDLVDSTHPLGFYTPFQFLDINFDGQKELMISDGGMCLRGDKYYTYSIDGNQLKKIDSLPIREVQTYATIDSENKTITIIVNEGPVGSIFNSQKFMTNPISKRIEHVCTKKPKNTGSTFFNYSFSFPNNEI